MAVQHQQKCNCSALTIKSTQGTTAQGLLTTKILAIEYIGNGEIAEQKKGLSNNCIHMSRQIWEKNIGTRAEHAYKIWGKKKK